MTTWQILGVLLIPRTGNSLLLLLATIGFVLTAFIWGSVTLFFFGVASYALFLCVNAYQAM